MKKKLIPLLSILAGNAMIAFAVCAFVIPKGFVLGGSNGIALTLQMFIPIRLSLLVGALQVSLFLLGWAFMGWSFAATSLLSTIIYPIFVSVFETLPLASLFTEDMLTCAIFCSVIMGVGLGLVIRVGASSGGMDIPPCILNKYFGIPVSRSLMVFDCAIIIAQFLLKGTEGVLYSILITVVISTALDRTLISASKKVEVTIISPEFQQIRQTILTTLDSGVTMLDIETGYRSDIQKAVYSVVPSHKYPAIRDAVLTIDPQAFIVASEVSNVNGKGYTLDRQDK